MAFNRNAALTGNFGSCTAAVSGGASTLIDKSTYVYVGCVYTQVNSSSLDSCKRQEELFSAFMLRKPRMKARVSSGSLNV